MGYYGKPVGIPKPKFGEIDAPLVLDLMEGIYLLDKKIINIRRLKICRDEYHEFDKKYAVYILERKIYIILQKWSWNSTFSCVCDVFFLTCTLSHIFQECCQINNYDGNRLSDSDFLSFPPVKRKHLDCIFSIL